MKTKEELMRLREERIRRLAEFDYRPGVVNKIPGLTPEQMMDLMMPPFVKRTSPVTIAPLREQLPLPKMPGRPLPTDDYEHCLWLAEHHEKMGDFGAASDCYRAALDRARGNAPKRYREPIWLRFLRWLVR